MMSTDSLDCTDLMKVLSSIVSCVLEKMVKNKEN